MTIEAGMSNRINQLTSLDWRKERGLDGATFAVLGMARTGRAAAATLLSRGARVLGYDQAAIREDEEIQELRQQGLSLHTGAAFPGVEDADAIVPSPGMPRTAAVLQDAVGRKTPVLSEIEVAYRISLAPMVAFTGTNGKSTTTALCGHMLKCSGIDARIGGNLAPGTPLIRLADRSQPHQVLVAEVSSFQLEWIQRFRPRVAAILNLSPEHSERHPTLQEYGETKAKIAENQSGRDLAIFGAGFAEQFPELMRGEGRHCQFSRNHPVEQGAYLASGRMRVVGRVDPWEGSLPDLTMDVTGLPLAGGHSQENAMAATLAALEMGAGPEAILRALRTFRALPHRMEFVLTAHGVQYVNNSMCTNPAAGAASLEAVDGGVVAIAGGRSKGLNMTPFARALARRARWTVLIGETADEMAEHLKAAGSRAFQCAHSMDEAVRAAQQQARAGDTVLLVPGFSSFDMFTDFEARGRAFVDAVLEITGGAVEVEEK